MSRLSTSDAVTFLIWLQTGTPVLIARPITVTGVMAFLLSLAALLSIIYGYAKGLARLNGYGERLNQHKVTMETFRAQATEFERQVQRVTVAQEQLLREIAAAQKTAEGCGAQMQDFAIQIGSKIDEMRRESRNEARETGERLASLETAVRMVSSSGEPERRSRPPRGENR